MEASPSLPFIKGQGKLLKPLQSTGVCQRHGPGSFNLIRIAHPITGDHACVMILDRFCCIPRKSCRYSFSQELMSKGRIKHKGSTYIYIYIYIYLYILQPGIRSQQPSYDTYMIQSCHSHKYPASLKRKGAWLHVCKSRPGR